MQAMEMTECGILMCDPLIRYVMVRDATAGCFDLRVERRQTADPCGMTNKKDKAKKRVERGEES
jgi:hypothetical protein